MSSLGSFKEFSRYVERALNRSLLSIEWLFQTANNESWKPSAFKIKVDKKSRKNRVENL